MALNNYRNNSNYPDRYTRNTRWKKVLPVQGRPIQTAELIETQSIIQDNIKQGFDTLFKSGTVVKGLRLSILDIGTDTVSLIISEGQIYIEGHILDVKETTLNVPSVGLYNIDILVQENIIDETIDPSLRDPIKGAFTIGTPGASRLVWNTSVSFSRESEFVINGYAIAQISEGVILQKDLNPFYQVEKSVSQFIYEKSGNFCVEGLETSYIGFDKKINSDISKQEELEVAVQQAKDQQQRALSNAIGLQTRISNLNSRLDQAKISSLVDQAIYQPIIARLTAELTDANLTLAQFSEDLIDSSKALESANTDLKSIEAIIADQQILSISPGVAYIEGYRVATNSATKLFIPQSFPTKTVENAAFTYRAESSQTLRNFTIADGTSNITVPSDNYITIEIKFEDIANNNTVSPEILTGKFTIDFILKINVNTTLSSALDTILSILSGGPINIDAEFFIRDEEKLNAPLITTRTTNSGTFNLTKEDIRDVLLNYIFTTKNNDSLVFKAQSNTLKSKEITVDIRSNLYTTSNIPVSFNTGIIISPSTGPLSQEISKSIYKLGFTPVNKITRLTSDLQVDAVLIRNASGVDAIQNEDTVLSVDSVTYQKDNGSPIITYNNPRDYTLTRNNIEWNLDRVGTIPEEGTSYRVTYTYTEVLVQTVDYILDRETDSIRFVGRTPKINGRFNVDYSYFLSKAGVVTIDKDGIFGFALSAASRNPVVPTVSQDKLSIASFTVNNVDLELQQLNCRRQTVKDLHDLAEDILINKSNNESLKLDLDTLNNAVLTDPESVPIGIFSTTLNNLDKLDQELTNGAFIPGIQAVTNGFFNTELDIFISRDNSLTNQLKNPTGEVEYITIPFSEKILFKQSRATKTEKVQPKSQSIKQRGAIYISENVIFKNQGVKTTDYTTVPLTGEIVTRDYYTLPSLTSCDPLTKQGILFSANNEDSEIVNDIQANIKTTIGSLATTISNSIQKGRPTTLNKLNSNELLNSVYNNVYTRQIEFDVVIDSMPSREAGVNLYLDGQLLILDSSKITSGNINTANFGINLNEAGRATLKIRVPEDVLTGTHTIEAYKEGRVYAKTNFYVYNTLLNQLVITPVKNWNAQPVSVSSCTQIPLSKVDIFSEDIRITGLDPAITNPEINSEITKFDTKESEFPLRHKTLNQTFVPNQTYFLTKAKIKVKSEPTTENNARLDMFLTSCVNDLPTKDVLAKAETGTLITTSLGSGNPGDYSEFKFNSLPLLKKNTKYNLGLEAISPINLDTGFEVYTSVVDDVDLSTNSIVGNQLYLDGDLLKTIDGITLYLKDKEDLTFELYRAEFNNSYIVDLGSFGIGVNTPISNPNQNLNTINYFCLNTRDIIPEGTDIIYRYSIDSQRTNKIPFKPNSTICLNSPVATLYIEAELITNFKNVAPQLLTKGSSVSLYSIKPRADVVSKQVEYPEPYKNIKVSLQYIQPAGTTIKVFYSPTNGFVHEGVEWKELTLDPNKTFVINNALQLYNSTYSLSEPTNFYYDSIDRKLFRYKIELTSQNGLTPLVRNITSIVS